MARANKSNTTNGADSAVTEQNASDAGHGITGVDQQQQQQNGVFFTRDQSLWMLGGFLQLATSAAQAERLDLMARYTGLCNYIGESLGIRTGQTSSGIGDLPPPDAGLKANAAVTSA